MKKNGEGLPIQVYGDRYLFMQKLSPNKPVYVDMAQVGLDKKKASFKIRFKRVRKL